MTTLSNGEFVFVGHKRQLFLLEKGTNQEAYTIYGGEVLAAACSEDGAIMALALPPSEGRDFSIVRLYSFADNELGEALDEVRSSHVTQLLWVGLKYLVMCGRGGCSIYTWNGEKLKFFVSDSASSAFLQMRRLGLLYEANRTVKYWDLDSNRMMDSIALSSKKKRFISAVGVGYFGFALYDDGSLQAFYVTKSTIKKLQFFPCLFSIPKEGKEKLEAGGGGAPSLLACALSSRKVLVGLHGDDTVHKLEYKNEKELVDSMQSTLPSPYGLVAISRDGRRCLALNKENNKYHTLVLSFSGTRATDAEVRDKRETAANSKNEAVKDATLVGHVEEEVRGISSVGEGTSMPQRKSVNGRSKKLKIEDKEGRNRASVDNDKSIAVLAGVGIMVVAVALLAARIVFSRR